MVGGYLQGFYSSLFISYMPTNMPPTPTRMFNQTWLMLSAVRASAWLLHSTNSSSNKASCFIRCYWEMQQAAPM